MPLLYPAVPPLTDVPGHMGRFTVQLGAPDMQRWYSFHWALLPNLGVDLLVQLLGPWMGVEASVKLIVAAIPALQMAGFVLVARQAHGHVPVTVLFALPLAWCFPLHFGFINYMLSAAGATLAFASWMGMRSRPFVRGLLFAAIACVLWVAHMYGWGILGLLIFCEEFGRGQATGNSKRRAFIRAVLLCLPLLAPEVLKLLMTQSGDSGPTSDWFRVDKKLGWLVMVFRDRWMIWDLASFFLIAGLIGWGLRSRRFAKDPGLLLGAGGLTLAFVIVPTELLGSYFDDMRLVPVVLGIAILALRPGPTMSARTVRHLACIGIAFFAARILGNTTSMFLYDRAYAYELPALDHIPRHSTMVALVYTKCSDDQGWTYGRQTHLPSLALVRNHAFANDQWTGEGVQLLRVRLPQAEPFEIDPSQRVTPRDCDTDGTALDTALHTIPPVFDRLWIMDGPTLLSPPGWRLIWHRGTSGVYARASAPKLANE